MPFAPVNPLANFLGLFTGADVDQRAILEELSPVIVVNYINDLALDVLEEFSFTSEFDITDRPVESGFPVTDSRRRLPDVISLVAVQVTGQNPEEDTVDLEGTPLTDGKSWKDKYDELVELKNKQELVTLTTGLDTYDNLLIRTVNITRAAGDRSDALFFTIDLKESTFAESQVAQIDPNMIPQKKRKKKTDKNKKGDDQGSGNKDKGNRDSGKDKTLLKSMLTGLAESSV